MVYIIDTANNEEIEDSLSLGINGITANSSMYLKNNENFYSFLNKYSSKNLDFLSGEVMSDTFEDMVEEVNKIQEINKNIVIKINFSKEGLKLCKYLKEKGIKSAMTLIFNVAQALASINAGADYLFVFIGRNDDNGHDGLSIIESIQSIVKDKDYKTKVVAASIKNLYQLEKLSTMGIDFAAIPYNLYIKSLYHPLTESGIKTFKEDWKSLKNLNNL
ncbi:transaldolase family protein [Clostridium amazonitimonense]|uniref:transaldolase family protein n=1 Tax=Clostridium amazonitimonense TaxID=1499689 RepID=UPI000509E2B4|nr:transaldolase family protein [Clostridium amazonitimonense]